MLHAGEIFGFLLGQNAVFAAFSFLAFAGPNIYYPPRNEFALLPDLLMSLRTTFHPGGRPSDTQDRK